jgi:hypothetical protein
MNEPTMNVPAFRVYKHLVHGWYAETYIFGHLITTCKRGRGGSVRTFATPAEKEVHENGFIAYKMNGMDVMTKKEPLFTAGKRATEKTVERCHASALLLFIAKHNPEAQEAANA